MEENNLHNKVSQLNKDFHKSFKDVSKFMEQGMRAADKLEKDIFAQMTNEQISKYKAFERRYKSFMDNGEFLEANNLKETYLNEQL